MPPPFRAVEAAGLRIPDYDPTLADSAQISIRFGSRNKFSWGQKKKFVFL